MASVALMALGARLHVAGVALGDIDVQSAWQAWHLATSTCIPRGVAIGAIRNLHRRRGTYGTGWAPVPPLVPGDAAPICVAGVALDIDVQSAWRAWHLWHWAGSCQPKRSLINSHSH